MIDVFRTECQEYLIENDVEKRKKRVSGINYAEYHFSCEKFENLLPDMGTVK